MDPEQVIQGFQAAEKDPSIHTIVIDSLTFLMDMYESVNVIGASDTMKQWSNYAQYFKNMMQQEVARSTKRVVFTAHTAAVLNESDMVLETVVPVKGSLRKNGLESYFSCVVAAKKMTIKALEPYKSPLLTFTAEEVVLGFKYCFQVKLTKETVGDRIRSPMGMWEDTETYINNDINLVFTRLEEYYD